MIGKIKENVKGMVEMDENRELFKDKKFKSELIERKEIVEEKKEEVKRMIEVIEEEEELRKEKKEK